MEMNTTMLLGRLCAAALLVGATLAAGGGVAGAATGCGTLGLRAHWPMDEPPGAGTMHDVVGGRDGAVRYAVTGLTSPASPASGSFYGFGRGSAFPKGSQVTVADSDVLDPGGCDFRVEIWVNWDRVAAQGHTTYNVTQKGLSSSPGDWKLEVDGRPGSFGRAMCTFDGANDGRGAVQIESTSGNRVDSTGGWTHLGCERRGNDFVVQVGNTEAKRTVSNVGPIANSQPLTVGAKALNDSDTFPGDIDDLQYFSAS
jgi:hypothetical protein